MERRRIALCLCLMLASTQADEALAELWWKPTRTQINASDSFHVPVAIRNGQGMELILAPPGNFLIGSPKNERDRKLNEGTLHLVSITRPFYVQADEVSQAEWYEVMGRNPSNLLEAGDDAPVESISWFDAVVFCNKLSILEGLEICYRVENMQMECHFCQNRISVHEKTCPICGAVLRTSSRPIYGSIQSARVTFLGLGRNGYRLPTEAEWEYACRAESITAYSFGAQLLPEHANFKGSLPPPDPGGSTDWGTSVPGRSYEANTWGVYDMHGNVEEWCWDRYAHYPEAARRVDPVGPDSGDGRIKRGGNWGKASNYCRSARREHAPAALGFPTVGLRVVRSVIAEE